MSERGEGAPRRNTHVEHAAVYAAVGASAEPDLMRFPPDGSTPYEFEVRLGSGAQRFLVASSTLMTWGAQRGIGIAGEDIDEGDGGRYRGVAFDEHGTPQPLDEAEQHYGPDGEAYVTVGTSVTLRWPDGRSPRRMRVVYTVDEPRRIGYAWGTADTDGVIGEELFVVEHREDDTVWAGVRGFLWPAERGLFGGGVLGGGGKSSVKKALKESQAQLSALVTGVLPAED